MQLPEGAAILTAAAMRAAEQAAFASGIEQTALMERAGLAVAREAHRLAVGRRVLVAAGPGNNGGDAYVAARLLATWGHDVMVVAAGRPTGGAARDMAGQWRGETTPFDAARPTSDDYLLIDGLFGTGVSRPLTLSPGQRALFEAAAYRVAIDQPSHLSTDTGEPLWEAPAATMTVSFGALKPVHALARAQCGQVVLDDIGIAQFVSGDWRVIERPVVAPPLPTEHKYRAHVTIVGGAMPGAARLAARGAVGAGAGYVVLIGDLAPPLDAVVVRPASDLSNALRVPRGWVVVGPGLGRDDHAKDVLDAALASPAALVLDGDALTLLGDAAAERLSARTASTVLTPHEGEFARMFGDGGGDKISRTLQAQRTTGATIVHKGAATVIATGGGQIRVSTGGSPWLATAGTGDVLASVIATRGAEAGVWLHARASRLAAPAFCADGFADALPRALGAAW